MCVPSMSGLSRLMLKEGMCKSPIPGLDLMSFCSNCDIAKPVYFVTLTAVNILNLVLFHVAPLATQSSAACLGQAVTMIMSERIIIGLHEWQTLASSDRSGGDHQYELSGPNRRATMGGMPGAHHNPFIAPISNSTFASYPDFTRSKASDYRPSALAQVRMEEYVKADYDSTYSGAPRLSVENVSVWFPRSSPAVFTHSHTPCNLSTSFTASHGQ
jgi:hypothetical protein